MVIGKDRLDSVSQKTTSKEQAVHFPDFAEIAKQEMTTNEKF